MILQVGFFFLIIGLSFVSYFFIDQQLLYFIHNHINSIFQSFFELITKLGCSNLYLILSLICVLAGLTLFRGSNLSRLSFYIFLSILLTGFVIDSIKYTAERARPRLLKQFNLYGFELNKIRDKDDIFPTGKFVYSLNLNLLEVKNKGDENCKDELIDLMEEKKNCHLKQNSYELVLFDEKKDYDSFPSGHSGVIFCFAACLSLIFRNRGLSIILFLIAGFIASSRLFLEAHYLSDVIVGSYLGYLVASLVWILCFDANSPLTKELNRWTIQRRNI